MTEPLSFLGQSGPYSTLRRSAVDPITGNATLGPLGTGDPNEIVWRGGLLPVGRTRDGRVVPAGSQLGKGVVDFISAIPDIVPEGIKTIDTAGRMMRGEVPMHDEDGRPSLSAIGTALGAAGLAATGSLPFSAPEGALRMFGGRAAKTADLGALGKAEGLASLGTERQSIWDQTGWFQGADKKWRFEIPDDAAAARPMSQWSPGNKAAASQSAVATGAVDDFIDHGAMRRAYPDAMMDQSRIQMMVRPQETAAGTFGGGELTVGTQGGLPNLSTSLHEMQHAIQEREGFAQGASLNNPAAMQDPSVLAFRSAKIAAQKAGDDAAATAIGQQQRLAMYDFYQRHAGEVEARNVQTRQAMTPEQRRATPPWQTQDIPDADQIVRLGPLGALGR